MLKEIAWVSLKLMPLHVAIVVCFGVLGLVLSFFVIIPIGLINIGPVGILTWIAIYFLLMPVIAYFYIITIDVWPIYPLTRMEGYQRNTLGRFSLFFLLGYLALIATALLPVSLMFGLSYFTLDGSQFGFIISTIINSVMNFFLFAVSLSVFAGMIAMYCRADQFVEVLSFSLDHFKTYWKNNLAFSLGYLIIGIGLTFLLANLASISFPLAIGMMIILGFLAQSVVMAFILCTSIRLPSRITSQPQA